MKRIIVLLGKQFNKFTPKRLGYKVLEEHGFEVLTWDVSLIYNPNLDNLPQLTYQGLEEVKTMEELLHRLENEVSPDDLILCSLNFSRQWKPVYELITRKNLTYVVRQSKMHPNASRFINYLNKKPLFSGLRNRLSWKRRIKMPDYLIIATEFSKHHLTIRPGKNTRFIKTHADDYNEFLALKESQPVLEGKYAVFIDQNLPANSDFALLKRKPPVTAEPYYQSLCMFFEKFQKQTGIPIVLAAHPKTSTEFLNEVLPGFRAYYLKTAELIKHSTLVLGHYSTAFNFGILYNKQIVPILTREMIGTPYEAQIRFIGGLMHVKCINIDEHESVEWVREEALEKGYRDYISKYIKETGTKDINSWAIFAEEVQKSNEGGS